MDKLLNNKLGPEISLIIYIHTEKSIFLMLAIRKYYQLFTSPAAKAVWVLEIYGETFTTIDLVKSLLKSNANLSTHRYSSISRQQNTQLSSVCEPIPSSKKEVVNDYLTIYKENYINSDI